MHEFHDMITDELPPMRGIQHAANVVLGSKLPNLPHYWLNPKEGANMNRVEGLLWNGYISP